MLVAGSPHGAATITSIVLGQNPDLFPVGELKNFPDWRHFTEQRFCSCRMRSVECEFWRNVREQYAAYQHLPEESRTPQLYDIIARESGRPIVVDMSHDIDRTERLCRFDDLDLYLIHVVRDGRAVVNARLRHRITGARTSGWERLKRTAKGSHRWWQELKRLARLEKAMGRKAFRLYYEDLCKNPHATLQKLGDFLALDLTDIGKRIADEQPLTPAPHLLRGGGKFVRQERLVLRYDSRFLSEMSALERCTFGVIAGFHSLRGF